MSGDTRYSAANLVSALAALALVSQDTPPPENAIPIVASFFLAVGLVMAIVYLITRGTSHFLVRRLRTRRHRRQALSETPASEQS